ncbi:MAG: FtsX-like permease family protein, partial [Akkermansiaceae bacterium]|nr:FtsX-like permease family protein [Akkermansiaceae bacterium]
LFLMAAAVALAAMLFRFHIEQRNRESGLLAAVGVPPPRVMRWRLAEGLVVVALGGGIGLLLALGYTRLLLASLATVWDGDGEAGRLALQVNPLTVVAGLAGFAALMMLTIWLVTRRQIRRSASLRLEAGTEEAPATHPPGRPWWAAGWAVAGLLALAGHGWLGEQGAFFIAGFCLLTAGLTFYRHQLRRRLQQSAGRPAELTVQRLVALNCARRPTRSLVVAGTLAAGVFMVVSVAAFRKDGSADWRMRSGGTGGYALWAETTQPLGRAGTAAPDDILGLAEARHRFGEILPLRVGPGDDASCLNLNRVLRPRLLAVDPATLHQRHAFTIKKTLPDCEKDWLSLRDGEVMRAFVDESTLLWVLKRKLGDRLIYQDETGRDYPVEIAGTLEDSVFQGCFMVDEARFLRHHPQAPGARVFLLDAKEPVAGARVALRHALEDRGVLVDTTAERMAAFHGVENAYIRIFHLLGGLGVILGSAGLGLLTARNLVERQQEFAILHTLGVPAAITRRLVLGEAAQLARWGLALGFGAALMAILPGLGTAGVFRSALWLGVLAGLIAVNGWFWSWLACRRYFRASFTTAAPPAR